MSPRGSAVLLAAVVALSVGIRLVYAWAAGDDRVWGWQWIQVTYLELGTNIAHGRGYTLALAPDPQSVQLASPGLPSLENLPHDFDRPNRPLQYFLPGYAYLVAPAIALAGADWQTARTFNAVLDEHGLSYGPAAGDAFLLRASLDHLRESPGFLVHAIAVRGRDVVRYGFEGWFEWWPALADLRAALGLILAAVAAVGAVAIFRRQRFLFGLLACLWLSRVVPISVVEVQPRFLIPLQVAYACAIACGVAAIIATSHRLPRLLSTRAASAGFTSKVR